MNLLVDVLPTAVEIGGIEYPINSDFRDCLQVILAIESDELTGQEKQMIMLNNLYPQPVDDVQTALSMGMKFLNGGKTEVAEDDNPVRLFSFDKDAGYILAAFKETHDIDLENIEYLHWWKFLAFFMSLGSNTKFLGDLIWTRQCVKNGTATKDQKKIYEEHPEIYELAEPDNRSLEEKEREAEFMRLVNGDR